MEKKRVILYGASTRLYHNYYTFKLMYNIVGVSDTDVSKRTKVEEMGEKFIEPQDISKHEFDYVIVTSMYYKEISLMLIYSFNIERSKILRDELLYMEQEACMGELNPDRTFYVFRQTDPLNAKLAGLATTTYYLVHLMRITAEKGYEFLVDFQNNKNIFLEDSKLGKENAWEYFFKQPCGETCETVYNSKNVILGLGYSQNPENVPFSSSPEEVEAAYNAAFKKYIVPSDDMQKRIDDEYDRLLRPIKEKGKKICGVLYRGTDYTKLKFYHHPIQPTIEQAVEKTKELMSEWGFDYIYFDSEDNKALKAFCEAFPDKVLYSERARLEEYPGNEVIDVRFDRENDKFLKQMEIVRSIFLMTRCDFFISAEFSASTMVCKLRDDFENVHLINYLGRYGIDDDAYFYTPDGKPVYVKTKPPKETPSA